MKQREKTVSILDQLSWSVQPPKGLIKGSYYREEERFSSCFNGDPGHLGILEVVADNGRLLMVEFNEQCSPTYYMREFQNADKRLSNYGFFQATKERTASTGVVLVNGITSLEKQMVEKNQLCGDFDLVAGASNSIKRSMLPLAEKIAGRMLSRPSTQRYYGLSMELEAGVTGRLQVVVENKKIIRLFYDEIFADTQEEISDPELKPYYRQSKYHCPSYISASGAGFNSLSDRLTQTILKHQDLLNLHGLPYTEGENRAPEWDRYLSLARPLWEEILKDKAMSCSPVFETTILSSQLFTAKNGRKFQLFTLACPDFTYQPGQFIMVQEQGEGFCWSYPYMVYHSTAEGPQIIAGASSSLFGHQAGDRIAFWGANGRACQIGKKGRFITEPAMLPLILPLIRACANPDVLILGEKEEVPLELLPDQTLFLPASGNAWEHWFSSEMYDKENKTGAEAPVYMALNLPGLEMVMPKISPALAEHVFVFASTQIGCGIGACKACYLHSPEIHLGIPVCCHGPYLPYLSIDFAKDKKCFETII